MVNVSFSLNVPQVTSICPLNKGRINPHRSTSPHRAIHTTGD
jgi:hypothetical protein